MVNIRISEPDPNEDHEFPAIDQHREEAKEMPGQHLNPLATQPGEHIDFGDAEDAIQEITDEAQAWDDAIARLEEWNDFRLHTAQLKNELIDHILTNEDAFPTGEFFHGDWLLRITEASGHKVVIFFYQGIHVTWPY